MFWKLKNILISAAVGAMIMAVAPVHAAMVGDVVNFNVDPSYNIDGNSRTQAILVLSTSSLYFYVPVDWWNEQTQNQKNIALARFNSLASDFENTIYPGLTSVYGSEWNPGIDKDSKITLLFESMRNNLGGYVRVDDEYSKLQLPSSNEREMIYLPLAQISSPLLKTFLAHEFVHLIVFNQKDRLQGVAEELWLSEARSDYASAILGYDTVYEGSNLQRRVEDFLDQPQDSLTEWKNTKYDYAVETLFTRYLVDHYGIKILTDSLKSKLVGIPSLNEALAKNGFKETFSQIYTDWTITLIVNDCATGPRYCYRNPHLVNFKISPTLIFLPLTGDSSLSMNNTTKNWQGNWQKIIGGKGDLNLKFNGTSGFVFKVPYLVYEKNNNYTIKFLALDKQSRGEFTIEDFGGKYNSLIIIPTLQTKIAGFLGPEFSYGYNFTVSVSGNTPPEDPILIQKLQDQIATLKKQIADLLAHNPSNPGCTITANLTLGTSSNQVSCLQQFLSNQGPDIYPQALVTGYFGNLTKMAVVRFQEKYATEILSPAGITQGTGFVGPLTRQKINALMTP